MSSEPLVEVDVEGGVARIVLCRPDRKNAFNDPMWRELLAAMDGVLADRRARAVVLTGAGGNFTAGADVALIEGSEREELGEGEPHAFSRVMDHLIETFDKPIVAAVDGVAIGFGLTVLLHCDFVYVSDRVRLRAPFVRLGVVPEAGSSLLFAEVLGIRNAAELLFTADFIDGPRAVELGIANACVAPQELPDTAMATARRIAENPPGAVRATKRLLLDTRRDRVRAAIDREYQAFAERLGTPENLEAMQAFWEKRAPDFSKLPDE